MRLSLLVRRLSTHGGTERFVHGLAGWLLAQGHEVHCWCAAVDAPIAGVQVHLLPLRARGRVGKLLALDHAARAIPPDAQDLLLGFVRGGQPALYRAGGGSHRAWMARHGRFWGALADQVEARLDDRVLASARIVVGNSELAARDLERFSGVDPAKLRLVRNGVDLARFQPRSGPRPAGPPLVGFLGTGFTRKGLETALQALRLLPGVQLQVGGGDAHLARWQQRIRRMGLQDRVQLLGPVARPEAWLPTLDAFVLPTRYDPSANACMEALACGVPVLTSADNGACEVLPAPWMTVADSTDAPAFAAGLERALQSNSLQSTSLAGPCRAAAEALPAAGAFASILALSAELLAPSEAPGSAR